MKQVLPSLSDMCGQPPRVLNLHLGQPGQDNLAAINIKVSPSSAIAVTAEYSNGHFAVVRAAGLTDNLKPTDILPLLREWKRILHRFGLLYLEIPAAQAKMITGLLRKAGFSAIKPLRTERDLPALCGVDAASDSRLTLTAGRKKLLHRQPSTLPQKSFETRCRSFRQNYSNTAASFIIPVHNEAANLPEFLRSLESCANLTDTRREYIFVLNGCTDGSEAIVRDFIHITSLDCKVITSGKGILTAFIAGLAARKLDGFIGKLDADVLLDPQALDLLQMYLVVNRQVMVSYAEPMPLGHPNRYSAIYFQPANTSRRLFYIGQTCLLRSVPFSRKAVARMLPQLQTEDAFLSAYFTYFHGLESIVQTPHARTYIRPPREMNDLVHMISRTRSESLRVAAVYPPFTLLGRIFEREFYSPEFKDLYSEALSRSHNVEHWTRIENTKR